MSPTPEERAASFRSNFEKITQEVARAIVGQEEVVRQTLVALFAGGHVLLEGVPGLGKTYLVRSLADAVHLQFTRIQFTPDLMPADIMGTNLIVENERGQKSFEFQAGPVFTQLLLADEVNRATPKTQSAMLEAMQERSLTVAGKTRALPAPFFVLATQNPIEMEGTYPLPEAQLDRFLFKISVPYPKFDELMEISRRTTGAQIAKPDAALGADEIETMQQLVREVAVAPHVERFAAKYVYATHPTHDEAPQMVRDYVRFGASPRALQSLILAGKVLALIDGRLHVAFEDITAVAHPALRHRLILNFEGEAEGIAPDTVVDQITESIPHEAVGVG